MMLHWPSLCRSLSWIHFARGSCIALHGGALPVNVNRRNGSWNRSWADIRNAASLTLLVRRRGTWGTCEARGRTTDRGLNKTPGMLAFV